jgi:DNA-binding MarR family transcriptional regulator
MSTTLAGLASRGLVTRSADPRDGRRVVMSVTDQGRATLCSRRGAKVAAAMGATLTDAEITQLSSAADFLDRLADQR